MPRGIRQKEGEDLSSSKLEEVIKKLNQDKPITKKDACAMLNIAYNTTRLNKIIEEYEENKAYHTKRKKELRSTPLSKEDISYIISSYLEDASLSELEQSTHRSIGVIKRTLEKYGVPLRDAKHTYHNPPFLPDNFIKEEYEENDIVYSARYSQAAKIGQLFSNKNDINIYRIWLCKDEQWALQPYYELGDLTNLQKEFNLKIEDRHGDDIRHAIATTLINARKRKKDA